MRSLPSKWLSALLPRRVPLNGFSQWNNTCHPNLLMKGNNALRFHGGSSIAVTSHPRWEQTRTFSSPGSSNVSAEPFKTGVPRPASTNTTPATDGNIGHQTEEKRETPRNAIRRFYTRVTVESQCQDKQTWFEVHLDQRALKTPTGRVLTLPTQRAAELVANEWDKQPDNAMQFDAMPYSSLAIQALDLIHASKVNRAAAEQTTLRFLTTDTLLFLPAETTEDMRTLRRRLEGEIAPVLKDVERDHGLDEPLIMSDTLHPPSQDPRNLDRLAAVLTRQNDWQLSCVLTTVRTLKSYLLGVATVVDGRVSVARALELAHLEATYQQERWGVPEESISERAIQTRSIEAAVAFYQAVKNA